MDGSITINRPNPDILAPHLENASTPGKVAQKLLGIQLLNRSVVVCAEAGAPSVSNEAAWGGSQSTTSKPVFGPQEAESLEGYLELKRAEFVAAFDRFWTPEGQERVPVRAATRWAICARVLADLRMAIRQRPEITDPFSGMPWIDIVQKLASPATFSRAVDQALAALRAKPEATRGNAYHAWSGTSRSGMDPALAGACQVNDLVPEKDRASILKSVDEGLCAVDSLESARLFEILLGIIARNPVPTGPVMAELERALADFAIPDSGVIPMARFKSQTAWMRGLMSSPVKYKPCAVCGFPAFYEQSEKEAGGKPDHGWMAGSILGGGWAPGTADNATVDVAICLPCKAEKILTEEGVRRFGRHPILLFNVGHDPIPLQLITSLYDETWGIKGTKEEDDGFLEPGTRVAFGDVGDRMIEVKAAPSLTYLKTKLTYAFLALRKAGYDLAIDLPGAMHPIGIFGWMPEACREAAESELDQATLEARIRLLVSRLPFSGYGGAKADFVQRAAKQRSIMMSPWASVVRTLIDAVREMQKEPRLIRAITEIFEINGGACMRTNNLNLLEEAVAWAEAAHPTLSTRKEIFFNRGSATKAMSEAFDNMLQVPPEERLGVAMAALSRNINRYLRSEEAMLVPAVLADLQTRIGNYIHLPQAELVSLRNQLDPMIRAAIRLGVRYTPNQNNFVTRLKRRMNDPESVVITQDEELVEPATAAVGQA